MKYFGSDVLASINFLLARDLVSVRAAFCISSLLPLHIKYHQLHQFTSDLESGSERIELGYCLLMIVAFAE